MLKPLIFILVLYCVNSYVTGHFHRSLATPRLSQKLAAEASQWPGRGSKEITQTPVSKKNTKVRTGRKIDTQTVAVPSVQQAWQSGYAFSKELKPKKAGGWLRNEPWWMREEENRNPRLLPIYKPWWSKKHVRVTGALTLAELKAHAEERGLAKSGKKSEVLAALQQQEAMYDLSDDNFIPPVFVSSSEQHLGACYPVVYEKNLVIHPGPPSAVSV